MLKCQKLVRDLYKTQLVCSLQIFRFLVNFIFIIVWCQVIVVLVKYFSEIGTIYRYTVTGEYNRFFAHIIETNVI